MVSEMSENDLILEILKSIKRIAVVGLSGDPSKPSYRVARYLRDAGFKIIPVNPSIAEWLGEKSYPDITSIPEPVDIVLVFRRPERAVPFVQAAGLAGIHYVWLQEGVGSREAEELAHELGLKIVMDRCMLKEHRRAAHRL